MRVLFSTLGSLGDLYPLLSVAQAARDQGADCLFAVHGGQVEAVERAGFRAMPALGSLDDLARDLGMSDAALIRKTFDDPNFLFRSILPYKLVEVTRAALDWAGDIDLVACTFQAEAARLVAEIRGIPAVMLTLQPMMVMDPAQPPVIPGIAGLVRDPGALGTAWNRLVLRIGMTGIRLMHGAPVNAARRRLGLPPHRGTPYFQGAVPVPVTLGLYADFLHPKPVRTDPPTDLVGFCPYAAPGEALDAGMREFLEQGAPPIVFTLGSNAQWLGGDFYANSLDAARALGYRAVLLTGAGWQGRAEGADVIRRDYVPHQLLFPHAAAVVHHGGIGTLSRALEAGVPQVVVPFGTDQPDNAARLERLGVARTVSARRYDTARVQAALGDVLADPQMRSRAETLVARLRDTDGPTRAAAALIAVAERSAAA